MAVQHASQPRSSSLTCIIPTHGRDELLVQALESVAAQIRVPVSLRVVDDIGAKSTMAAVASFATHAPFEVTYVDGASIESKSAGASRNFGSRGASSTYLAFLDDDDVWAPEFLSAALEAIDSTGADLVVAWTWHVRGARRDAGLSIRSHLEPTEILGKNPGLTGSNFVVRREIYERIGGFDETLRVANDHDFLIRFLDAGGAYVVVPERLVEQVAHDLGQITSPTEARAQGLLQFLARYGRQMSLSQRRSVLRSVHGVRRVSSSRVWQRLAHGCAQLWYSNFREVSRSATNVLTRRRSVYHVRER